MKSHIFKIAEGGGCELIAEVVLARLETVRFGSLGRFRGRGWGCALSSDLTGSSYQEMSSDRFDRYLLSFSRLKKYFEMNFQIINLSISFPCSLLGLKKKNTTFLLERN